MIGIGKDEYNSSLDGMIDQNILPWVEDREEEGYPVWEDYEAVQRSTYFLNRQGDLIYQFNITTLNPEDPADYSYFINLILDFRANNGPNVLRVSEDYLLIQTLKKELHVVYLIGCQHMNKDNLIDQVFLLD